MSLPDNAPTRNEQVPASNAPAASILVIPGLPAPARPPAPLRPSVPVPETPVLASARMYHDLGWVVVPVGYRTKQPTWGEGWDHQRPTRDQLPYYFGGKLQNIGVLLGDASGGLVDVDLDCPEAVDFAPDFLPTTPTFGRASALRAHWEYLAAGATYKKYIDVKPGADGKYKTLLELRAGKEKQTVFPPSTHEDTGEPIEWTPGVTFPITPKVIPAASLEDMVLRIAVAALLARNGYAREDAVRMARGSLDEIQGDLGTHVRKWRGSTTASAKANATASATANATAGAKANATAGAKANAPAGATANAAAPAKANAPAPAKANAPAPAKANGEFQSAVDRWNADHPLEDLPRSGGTCPVCRHDGCYGTLPDSDEDRWCCFSTAHPAVGLEGGKNSTPCYHGDALDLEAHRRGLSRRDVLVADGYLGTSPPLRSRSLLSVCTIVEQDLGGVLVRRHLAYDELSGEAKLAGRPVDDHDVTALRSEIERLHRYRNKDDVEMGLQYSQEDVGRAIEVAARKNAYHPIRDYLTGLTWDGTARLVEIAERAGAEATPLNHTLLCKTLIAAVARARKPGCKVDTVLTLVGEQGTRKSSMFRVLGGDYFGDSPLAVGEKAGMETIRGEWIHELAELASLNRARDIESIKAFVSSSVDRFRDPYGRRSTNHPRSCIFVATTNNVEYLIDSTGNRRFWPVQIVRPVDLNWLREHRDQLWAEARHLYAAGAQWWLSDEEEHQLAGVHRDHEIVDPWAAAVVELRGRSAPARTWAAGRGAPACHYVRGDDPHGRARAGPGLVHER